VDYLEDRITGTEVFQRFKVLQDLGVREKNRYRATARSIFLTGIARVTSSEKSAGGRPPILNTMQVRGIQYAPNTLGRTLKSLAVEFGVSPSTVKSALSTDTTTIHDE